jgi:lysyl-tRNA synthetase class 1
MQWLNVIVDELVARHPDGEIIVSSGVSPSGTYHLGTLREVLTAEVILREVQRRGRAARHLHIVDDLDNMRKVPADVDPSFEQYLGKPLCDIPAPDGSDQSYADYFLQDLLQAAGPLHLQMNVVRAHQKYRQGFMVPVIEQALEHVEDIKRILRDVSGRELGDDWSPVQVVEDGYLKNRRFVSIDTAAQTITYGGKDDAPRTASYAHGDVKLSWRIDWPARWSLLQVMAEPFGRDHATKGGSYDTGKMIVQEVFNGEAPLPLPYNFINRTGETKKMSKSKGDVVTAAQLLNILPAEIVWFFILRYSPDKLLFFGEGETLLRLFDEFAELLAKPDKTDQEKQLLELCLQGVEAPTVSNVPFSHLVASYQAALRDADKTLEVIGRTEHADTAGRQADTIRRELAFIHAWLDNWAPDDMKFALRQSSVDAAEFSDPERRLFGMLAAKVAAAPADADGGWFHNAIYECRDETGLEPKAMFSALYRLLIAKTSGPRAGWFLSILPRDWLVSQLQQMA